MINTNTILYVLCMYNKIMFYLYTVYVLVCVCVCVRAPVILALFVYSIYIRYILYIVSIIRHCSVLFYQ